MGFKEWKTLALWYKKIVGIVVTPSLNPYAMLRGGHGTDPRANMVFTLAGFGNMQKVINCKTTKYSVTAVK